MGFHFSPKVFDRIEYLRQLLRPRGFELQDGFHFAFLTTFPFIKFPCMKLKFYNLETREVLLYSVDEKGKDDVVGSYFEGEL
jgi:hypothetical protein